MNLQTYQGLDGVKRGKLKGPIATSVPDILDALGKYRAVSDAGDHGAIMIWIDDAGLYRCHFCRFLTPIDSRELRSRAEVKKWLREWHPKLDRDPR